MKRKILIVDDQVLNREILKNILSDEYEVIEAEDGVKALEKLNQYRKELSAVILDLVMPNLDGYGVLEQFSKQAVSKDIPVIVASQEDRSEKEERALRCGANDFIMKPYNPGILRQRLSNLIELYESRVHISQIERDRLTGLYNKEAFSRKAKEMIQKNPDKQYMIAAMDIERFKMVNDSYGSLEGDRILQALANELKAKVKIEGGICGRVNADHFVALIPRNEEKLQFQKIAHSLKLILTNYPISMKLSLKVGIYNIKDRSMEVDLMCDRAFLAVESTKGKYGVSFAYYDDSIRQKMRKEQQILDSMKNAVAERQFQIYLQPKYDIRTEKIIGAEALVRWIHPVYGFMNPGEFIPLFEKNGFITEVDRYVWERTCEMISNRLHTGKLCVPVSVNVSRKDIYQEDLPAFFAQLIQKYDIDPKYLHLEVTESAYTQDDEQIIRVVRQLKTLGFAIEMDDFGSGYSSLNMFNKLPIDVLKLDMRFMQKETGVTEDHDILSFVIDMAKWMNLRITAEGVETQEQIERLRLLGCDFVQGYYYSKPIPEADFLKKLDE